MWSLIKYYQEFKIVFILFFSFENALIKFGQGFVCVCVLTTTPPKNPKQCKKSKKKQQKTLTKLKKKRNTKNPTKQKPQNPNQKSQTKIINMPLLPHKKTSKPKIQQQKLTKKNWKKPHQTKKFCRKTTSDMKYLNFSWNEPLLNKLNSLQSNGKY